MQWYYAENGEQIGPIEEEQLRQMAADGQLTPETLVWRAGMGEWAAYSEAVTEAAPVVAAIPVGGTAECRECGERRSVNEMVPYLGTHVCASCKDTFFQQIQEGAAPSGGGEGTTSNSDLMTRARTVLSGNWGSAIGICIVYFLIQLGINFIGGIMGAGGEMAGMAGNGLSNILQIFLLPPFLTGITAFFIYLSREENAEIGQLSYGFQRYWTSVGANFFRNLIIGGVAVLLMIPFFILIGVGIAAGGNSNAAGAVIGLMMIPLFLVLFIAVIVIQYMLQMTFYVVADDPSAGCFEALGRSRRMMKGMKWKFFCLNLRFIGWGILCVFTLGIGVIWLAPYMAATYACFYDDVRGRVNLI